MVRDLAYPTDRPKVASDLGPYLLLCAGGDTKSMALIWTSRISPTESSPCQRLLLEVCLSCSFESTLAPRARKSSAESLLVSACLQRFASIASISCQVQALCPQTRIITQAGTHLCTHCTYACACARTHTHQGIGDTHTHQ